MQDSESDLNHRIAVRVRELRGSLGISPDTLARKSSVSRSLLSLIERGESSPTAVILGRLAARLDVTLASLFETPTTGPKPASSPVARRQRQPQRQDPATGYFRRNISPSGVKQLMQIVEVHFPADARVAFETGAHDTRVDQQTKEL